MSIFDPLFNTGSGSCMSSTKLCVPGGTCDHFSSGETAAPPSAACVYLLGITPPSSHADDVISSGGVAGPRPPAPPCGACAMRVVPLDKTAAASTHAIERFSSRRIETPPETMATVRILPTIVQTFSMHAGGRRNAERQDRNLDRGHRMAVERELKAIDTLLFDRYVTERH